MHTNYVYNCSLSYKKKKIMVRQINGNYIYNVKNSLNLEGQYN